MKPSRESGARFVASFDIASVHRRSIARERAQRRRGRGAIVRDLRLRAGRLHPGHRRAARSAPGTTRSVLPKSASTEPAAATARRVSASSRAGSASKGALPTARSSSSPINFKFEFDLFGVGVDAGQTTFRLRHAYGEWGSFLGGPDQQPVHGRRHLSEHDRLLGPDGHGLLSQRPDPLDAVQDRYQSLRHRHRAAGQRRRRRATSA